MWSVCQIQGSQNRLCMGNSQMERDPKVDKGSDTKTLLNHRNIRPRMRAWSRTDVTGAQIQNKNALINPPC
jgi:hypothetical protein